MKAQAHSEGALHFFLLNLGAKDSKEDIFQFSMVPTMFHLSYHHVLNMFPKFSLYSPNMFSIAPHM